ncbi:hypothetical protein OK18_10650 [Chryseobacterium gallinarum]|uniref:Uncharacterized protein n=1 Tax=Chryseobacterium gallinarum TaxID=1324352 RepID=A0A0G3M1K3_CHRGL|nr:hypothetical protein [Chryseobacterium gallinarum]AKK73011.1 hypothetical protein OK18_10650 [Chryseobacterium gallinarum]
MKNLIILFTIFVACIQNKSEDFQLTALSPVTYEFKARENKNRIDYFYAKGNLSYNTATYEKLKKAIDDKTASVPIKGYHLYSIYVYKQTDVINKQYKGGKEGLDGHNADLLAYVRYSGGKPDIFYITENGNVIYDMLSGKEENFEFDQ